MKSEPVTVPRPIPFAPPMVAAFKVSTAETHCGVFPVPLWMKKNTHEFAAFHQTIFFDEQYPDKVKFDKFQIKMLE